MENLVPTDNGNPSSPFPYVDSETKLGKEMREILLEMRRQMLHRK